MNKFFNKSISLLLVVVLLLPNPGFAQAILPYMPAAGSLVLQSEKYDLPTLKGIRFDENDPFKFTFVFNKSDLPLTETVLKEQAQRIGRYFLAALTIPEKDLWVNLSPYEPGRIIPEKLGQTDLGKDMLGEDYVLKQLAASLTHPDTPQGEKYWGEINDHSNHQPSFSKVWIVPDKIKIYESPHTVVIGQATLKVMTEQDYQAQNNYKLPNGNDNLKSTVFKRHILPIIEKEVNEGKRFAHLRQLYSAIILAMWFKDKLKQSVLNDKYFGKNKIKGVDVSDPYIKQKIYDEYVKSFNAGAYKMVKIERGLNKANKKQYFSGGNDFTAVAREAGRPQLSSDRHNAQMIAGLPQADMNTGRIKGTAVEYVLNGPRLKMTMSRRPEGAREALGNWDMQLEQVDKIAASWAAKLVVRGDASILAENIRQGFYRFLDLYPDMVQREDVIKDIVNGGKDYLDGYFGIKPWYDADKIAEVLERTKNFLDAKKALGEARWKILCQVVQRVKSIRDINHAEIALAEAIYAAHADISIAGLTPGTKDWGKALLAKTVLIESKIGKKVLTKKDFRILMAAKVLGRVADNKGKRPSELMQGYLSRVKRSGYFVTHDAARIERNQYFTQKFRQRCRSILMIADEDKRGEEAAELSCGILDEVRGQKVPLSVLIEVFYLEAALNSQPVLFISLKQLKGFLEARESNNFSQAVLQDFWQAVDRLDFSIDDIGKEVIDAQRLEKMTSALQAIPLGPEKDILSRAIVTLFMHIYDLGVPTGVRQAIVSSAWQAVNMVSPGQIYDEDVNFIMSILDMAGSEGVDAKLIEQIYSVSRSTLSVRDELFARVCEEVLRRSRRAMVMASSEPIYKDALVWAHEYGQGPQYSDKELAVKWAILLFGVNPEGEDGIYKMPSRILREAETIAREKGGIKITIADPELSDKEILKRISAVKPERIVVYSWREVVQILGKRIAGRTERLDTALTRAVKAGELEDVCKKVLDNIRIKDIAGAEYEIFNILKERRVIDIDGENYNVFERRVVAQSIVRGLKNSALSIEEAFEFMRKELLRYGGNPEPTQDSEMDYNRILISYAVEDMSSEDDALRPGVLRLIPGEGVNKNGGLDFAAAAGQENSLIDGGVMFTFTDTIKFLQDPDFAGLILKVEAVRLR